MDSFYKPFREPRCIPIRRRNGDNGLLTGDLKAMWVMELDKGEIYREDFLFYPENSEQYMYQFLRFASYCDRLVRQKKGMNS